MCPLRVLRQTLKHGICPTKKNQNITVIREVVSLRFLGGNVLAKIAKDENAEGIYNVNFWKMVKRGPKGREFL